MGRPRTSQTRGQGPSGATSENPRGGGRTTRERDARGARPGERDGGSEIQDRVVQIRRVAKVKKGGRRLNFSALVVVGDGQGRVGVGLGKANTVPAAIAKGQEKARHAMFDVPMRNTTIPHEVVGEYESSRVLLKPASEGTGVIAGGGVRAVLELAGIKDVLTKALGSTTPVNLVKATEDGLKRLRTKAQIEQIRGVKVRL